MLVGIARLVDASLRRFERVAWVRDPSRPEFLRVGVGPSGVDRSSVMLLPLFLTPLSQLELIDVIGDFAPSTIVESVVDMEFKPVAVR